MKNTSEDSFSVLGMGNLPDLISPTPVPTPPSFEDVAEDDWDEDF